MRQFIAKKLDLKFILTNFAIYALDDEILELIPKAGCVGINIAIESGNQRVMDDVVLKPIKLHKIPGLIAEVQKRGMFVIANFIIGFPGETWEEIRETVRYAETCGADYVKFFIAMPLKNTKMWEMAKELDAFDVDETQIEINWRHGQMTSNDWTSKDIGILRAYEWDRINFGTPERRRRMTQIWGMDEAELAKIRKQTRDAVTFSDDLNNMLVN
jgi:anaerobic magnesium-protoporphyrin IX monomethyl ester cyclase